MMDSQEKALEQGKQEEKLTENVATPVETNEKTAAVPNETATADAPNEGTDAKVNNQVVTATEADNNISSAKETAPKVYKTKKEVLLRVKEIAQSDENPKKEEIDLLKTVFYKLHISERDAQQKQYLEDGGDPEKYQLLPDDDEEEFKAEMQLIKEKRAKIFAELESEKQNNLKKKLDIIEKIKGMATSPEEANNSFSDFKSLQQEWKETGSVPPEKASELWRNYQLYVEQFYDLLNLNRESREYDFKKNLEAKTKLCEAAEKLDAEEDVISAFHQLQDLHQEYREIGPVAKELREQIWTRFKTASTVINKKHQQHFEDLRSKEDDNLVKKTDLCEKAEELANEEKKGAGDWEKATKLIIGIQGEWKKIGFAPQKMNVKIFERFRAACDLFFNNKAEFFKNIKEQFSENIEKKRSFVEQAQALADSTDWKETSDKLYTLQKDWKNIGMVPKKIGDQLWNDFITACNHFFEARNAANAGTRNAEHENLEKKKDIITKLKELAENASDNMQQELQSLVEQYNAIGHVPYKDKDKIYKDYHDVVDKLYKDLHIHVAKRRLDNFKNNLKNVAERGGNALDSERSRLMRRYEGLKQEITTYENNLGFLNASSKKGNSLIDEMNRKVEKLKDDLKLVRDKIKAIDTENK